MTRFYHVRKYFITTIRDQVSDQDFLLFDEWPSSHYNSNSNMQVFYSSKNRYYMLNLMVLEPALMNATSVDYASSQASLYELLGSIILEHPVAEPAPHLSFAVMVLYRLFRTGTGDTAAWVKSQNGIKALQRLLDLCVNASEKKADFCAVAFKFMQAFLNPEDVETTNYCIENLPDFPGKVLDTMIRQVRYRSHTFLLQTGMQLLAEYYCQPTAKGDPENMREMA